MTVVKPSLVAVDVGVVSTSIESSLSVVGVGVVVMVVSSVSAKVSGGSTDSGVTCMAQEHLAPGFLSGVSTGGAVLPSPPVIGCRGEGVVGFLPPAWPGGANRIVREGGVIFPTVLKKRRMM